MFPRFASNATKPWSPLIGPSRALIWFQLGPSGPGRLSAVLLGAIDHRDDDHCDRHLVSWGGYAIWWLACAINQAHRFIGLIKVLSAWSTCATCQPRRGNFHSTLVHEPLCECISSCGTWNTRAPCFIFNICHMPYINKICFKMGIVTGMEMEVDMVRAWV